jgi:hypothetical protein
MNSQFYSGAGGTASIGSPPSELSITDWQVNPSASLNRFRNSKSGPYEIVEASWLSATVTITVEYDFGNSPFTAIQIGSRLSNVKLYLHQSASGRLDGPAWSFGALVVTATPQSLPVTGQTVTTRLTCTSDGAFSYPN